MMAPPTLQTTERFFRSGGVLPPSAPAVPQPRLAILPRACIQVSWSAPPPYADATMIALQALAEAGARAFIETVLRPAMQAITAERDASDAARWADDGGRV